MFGVPHGGKQFPLPVRTVHLSSSRQAYARARILLALCLGFVLLYFYTPRLSTYQDQSDLPDAIESPVVGQSQSQTHALYNTATTTEECSRRHDLAYLTDIITTRHDICQSSSDAPQLSCFESGVYQDRKDSFCISSYMTMNSQMTGLEFACRPEDSIAPSFHDYPQKTGVKHILQDFAKMIIPQVLPTCLETDSSTHTILLKRENPFDFWTSLLEIYSYLLTIDTLRMTLDSHGIPMIRDQDSQTIQLMVIDDKPRGPYLGFLHLLSSMPIIWAHEFVELNITCFKNVILPLPGASNPLLDTVASSCTSSQTLSVFVQRIFDFYHIPADRSPSGPITLTFVDTKGARKIADAQKLLTLVKMKYRDVEIKMADFSNMNLRDQLLMMRNTDILVGAHGSGLAHAMFLSTRSAVVEILPSVDKSSMIYRNLAKVSGHQYFNMAVAGVSKKNTTMEHDAEQQEMRLDEGKFIETLGLAIKGMYNRGTLSLQS